MHAHGLLARGREVLEGLFPGFTDALVAQGGMAGDLQANAPFVAGGRRFAAGVSNHTGLACSLLGIRDPDQLRTHPLRGALFESWVAGEIVKGLVHRGRHPDLRHYRESRGMEIDIVAGQAGALHLIECKSGATIHPSFFEPLLRLMESVDDAAKATIVYGGAESHPRRRVPVYSWTDIEQLARRVAGA